MLRATSKRSPPGRPGPALAAIVALFSALALPSLARAWVEAHVASDDIRVQIDRGGSARIEHKITLKVSGGPLKSFDIRGVDGDALPDPDGYIAPLREATGSSLESAVPLSLELLPSDRINTRDDGSPPVPVLRVRFDDEKGIRRGVYVLLVRYRTELLNRGLIKFDGAMGRVQWTSPIWEDGFDSARTTFELPSAPTPPSVDERARPAIDEGGVAEPSMFLSNVRRGSERDEIELLRTYAASGEPITWMIRVDGRALRAAPPKAAPPPSLSLPRGGAFAIVEDGRSAIAFAGAIGLFLLFSVLVALKSIEVTKSTREAGTTPRPFIPAPIFVRAAGAGVALVSGVALQLTMKTGTAGALLCVLAAALAAYKTPKWGRTAHLRGRGRWLPVAEREAFRVAPRLKGAYLDVSTRAGKALLSLTLAGIGAAVALLYRDHPYHATLLALDATPFLAIFCTGRLKELPPDPASAPARLLADIARRARKFMRKDRGEELRAVGRIHVPDGSPDADELRLGLIPKTSLSGFIGLEVGVVYVPGAGGAIEMPEILLRVTSGSPCEAAVLALAKHGRATRGRRPDERVILFTPRLPTANMTARIAAALARAVMVKAAAPPKHPQEKRKKRAPAMTPRPPATTSAPSRARP